MPSLYFFAVQAQVAPNLIVEIAAFSTLFSFYLIQVFLNPTGK
jgi:hypothetical protein